MDKFTCRFCGLVFTRSNADINRGRTKYCSRACYQKDKIGKPRSDRGRKTEDRECLICGTHFLVGGRGHKSKRAIFCGWQCSRKARFRHGAVAAEMSAMDAAHLAGLIEGEGSIFLYLRRDVIALRVTVSNTNMKLLKALSFVTKVGSIVTYKARKATHKDSGWWQVNAEAAESILKQIRPYMWIKIEQTDLALETLRRLRDPKLKADRSWHSEFVKRMKFLNKRGASLPA